MALTFEQLVETYINDMYSLALRLTGSKEGAEDLVQDVFVNLNMKKMTFGHVENPRAWLARILYRTFVDQWRKDQRSPVTLISYTEQEKTEYWVDSIACDDIGPEDALQADQEQKKVTMALSFLSKEQRNILVLHDMEGYTFAEIEKITGISIGTLKSRLHRGRDKLLGKLKGVVVHRGKNLRKETSGNEN
ncbi:MAG: RNA polymerase sigma factor [Gammaproteobacteria bacterium]|nr:RNA polymerase sigma factor [Gammaproteobacteria bacterium]MDH5802202.1 RNA polymerase sigma factor [Gammaproteobacteria bacterium]